MSIFTIGTLNVEPEIRENLFNELNYLSCEGIKLNVSENDAGKFLFLNCAVDDDNEALRESHETELRNYLAGVITNLLINDLTKKFMSRMLKTKYNCLDEKDNQEITQNAYSFLNELHDNPNGDGKIAERYNRIFNEVSRYLENNSQLYMEGFLRFRLKDYFQEVVEATEKAVDTFLMEKEYHEFIQLLRYFVEIQEPKIDEVHVLVQSDQEVYFLDETSQPVKPDQIHTVLNEFDQEIEYEDWLLSALITIAPKKIILHITAESDMVQTILNVFEPRVIVCKGCNFCKKHPKEQPH